MSSCPNVNVPEWKALVKEVGRFEAYRDYMETGGEIRTPEEVMNKLNEREALVDDAINVRPADPGPSMSEIAQDTSSQSDPFIGIDVSQLKNGRAVELANKLSAALNIPYEAVTAEQAQEITKNAKNPWAGQPAFFVGGKVYFVQDKMTSDMVLHEFSHPLVRAISIENPALFNSLYSSLLETETGQDIVREVSERTDVDSKFFKEEVIVKALEKAAHKKMDNAKLESGFGSFVKNLLFHIKQLLRKKFGKKISVSKLEADTTLDELAYILTEGDQISIDTEVVSEEDIVAYNNAAQAEITKDLLTIENKQIKETVNTFYDTISTHLNTLMRDKNFEELAPLLIDEYQRGDFQAMKANLSNWQTVIMDKADKLSEDINETKSRVDALTNTLFRLENVLKKVYNHTKDIANSPETQENTHKAYYYEKFIKHWEEFVNELDKTLRDNQIPNDTPIRKLVNGLSGTMKDTRDIINTMQADGARDALYEQLEPLNKTLKEKYEGIIKNLEEKGAPQARIDKIYQEYHGMTKAQLNTFEQLSKLSKEGSLNLQQRNELKKLSELSQKGISISRDKIEQLLKGGMGDANWFNSYLEGYLYNTDPIVGGLALYVKNAMNEVMIVSQQKYNDFASDLREDLKDAGYNPMKLGELGKQIGFLDKVSRINPETGELETKEVWSFLNPFKDYRSVIAEKKKAVDDATLQYAATNSKADHDALIAAQSDQKLFMRTYMNQEYSDEFYERQQLFEKDDLGRKAAQARDSLFEEMRALSEPNQSELDQIEVSEQMDALWRKYSQMHSSRDLNGNMKTGEAAQIAARLREYREASREFYEFKVRQGVFENAYFDFQQELRNKNIKEGGDVWNRKMEQWKKRNTKVTIKQEFYENRNRVLGEIKDLMSKLSGTAQKEIDQSKIWEQILEVTGGFRDEDGQPLATEMSEQAIAKVKALQEDLETIKENAITRSGLTKSESAALGRLFEKQKALKEQGKRLSADEQTRLGLLMDKKDQEGLSSWDIATLNSLYKELGEMSSKHATTHYVDIMNNWLSKVDTDSMKKEINVRVIDETDAEYMLDPSLIDPLLDQNDEFKQWFHENHLLKSHFDAELGEQVERYERVYVWSVVKPADPAMMETYEVKDSQGNVVDTVDGVPSTKFQARVVKEKYRTRNIQGVTKDNQGNYLPKTREQMSLRADLSDADKYRFINERYEQMKQSPKGSKEEALFRVLEKMKKHHLANQEGLAYSSRLGLDMPRYRKDGLEVITTASLAKGKNTISLMAKRVKDFFVKTSDQMEDGFNHEQGFNLVRADMFDNEMTDIPISGLYDIDSADVSTDVARGMMRYMLSAERQKQLVSISPIVRAIQNTVNNEDHAIQDLNRVNKKEFNARNILRFLPKKENVRKAAVNNFIEREFEGVTQADFTKDVPFLNNFANLLFKRASFSFFAMNIPSALKNSLGMKFQSMIEASGGTYVDHLSLQKGNAWAYKAMGELSFTGQLSTRGPKKHMQQMVDVFDMVQGRFEENFGRSMSRSLVKDAVEGSWLYSPRKWVEIQAGLQLASGMLYKKKVTITNEQGETSEIPYQDAFETIDGQIRLKDGVDVQYGLEPTYHTVTSADSLSSIAKKYNTTEEVIQKSLRGKTLEDFLYKAADIEELREEALAEARDRLQPDEDASLDDIALLQTRLADREQAINNKFDQKAEKNQIKIDNSEFKFMKNRMHQVANNMGGAYAKFDQPEAQRYLVFRMISYMRRYFTTMATNRWGFSGKLLDPKPRLNPGMGDVQMGFYIQFGKFLARTIRTGGAELKFMTADEKSAFLKFASELVFLMAVTGLSVWLFGWDDEDDDRYRKLREKSGALPFPFTTSDQSRDFNLLGYMEVHALHTLMQVRAENEQFNLITGGLKQYNSLLDIKSVALGPTTDSYMQILDDMKKIATGDPKASYSRTVGPYDWQQKGGSKLMTHVAKTFGLTGSSLDPAMAIQNFQSYQAKVRR